MSWRRLTLRIRGDLPTRYADRLGEGGLDRFRPAHRAPGDAPNDQGDDP